VHIVYICQYFPPEMGAPAARAYEFSRRWVKAGHRVSVICGIPNHPTGKVYDGYQRRAFLHERIEGIDVYRTWVFVTPNAGTFRRSLNFLSFGLSSILAAEALTEVDVCIATTPQFLAGISGAVVSRMKSVPYVLEVRDLWPDSINVVVDDVRPGLLSALRRIEHRMYRAADRIVIVSEAFRPHIRDTGIADERISYVPNGVNSALFFPRENARMHFNGALKDKFLVGYIGTHGLAHGLETALATAELLKEDDRIHFLFVGEGARKPALKKAAEGLRNVTFVDRLPRETIAEMLSELDVALVHLKKAELLKTVIPSKMFEIMGAAKPIILGVEGEAKRILDEAGAGIAIEPENAYQLKDAIMTLRNDPFLCKRLGANGSTYARACFDLDVLADRYLNILCEVCI
jgi:glycosyltransferase involved in cell wall biosynthesis